jgi:hypothetical protein
MDVLTPKYQIMLWFARLPSWLLEKIVELFHPVPLYIIMVTNDPFLRVNMVGGSDILPAYRTLWKLLFHNIDQDINLAV